MAFDPGKLESLVLRYSSLTQVLIGLGFDAVAGVKALIEKWHTALTPEERNQIIQGVLQNSNVRELLARQEAGQIPPPIQP